MKIIATLAVVMATEYIKQQLPEDDRRKPVLQAIQAALISAIDGS